MRAVQTRGKLPLRILLIGFSYELARSIARYLAGEPRLALVGIAPSLDAAEALVPRCHPALALVDGSLLRPGGSAGAARRLKRIDARLRVLAVVSGPPEAYAAAAVDAGLEAVIARDQIAESLEELLAAPQDKGSAS